MPLWRKAADKLVKLWDTATGEIVKTFVGHTEGISDVSWSPDGEFLASASDDKTVRVWSLENVRIVACNCFILLKTYFLA
jgi:COMPASS component SWD3